MSEQALGQITHYFAKPEVGVIKLTGNLSVGETLHFRGHSTDFQQRITSMQVEHENVESAAAGSEVAVKVDERVRPGDEVFKVAPD
jgi:putative protease